MTVLYPEDNPPFLNLDTKNFRFSQNHDIAFVMLET